MSQEKNQVLWIPVADIVQAVGRATVIGEFAEEYLKSIETFLRLLKLIWPLHLNTHTNTHIYMGFQRRKRKFLKFLVPPSLLRRKGNALPSDDVCPCIVS